METTKQVYQLLADSLWGEAKPLNGILTEDVAVELDRQRLFLFCLDTIKNARPETDTVKQCLLRALAILQNQECYKQEIRHLNRLLTEHGYTMVLLKGFTSAALYPNPSLRPTGDIDLYITKDGLCTPEIFARGVRLLEDNGYTNLQRSILNVRHQAFVRNEVDFEIHQKFSHQPEGEPDPLEEEIRKGLIEKQTYSINGETVYGVGKREQFLVLADHCYHHAQTGIGIRQILDVCEFAYRYLDDETWETEYRPLAERFGWVRFLQCIVKTAMDYLGMPQKTADGKPITWADSVSPDVTADFIRFLYDEGNFGKLGSPNAKNATVDIRKLGFFRAAQKRGLITWQAAREHAYLRPFAWAYQIGRWGKNALTGRYGNHSKTMYGIQTAKEKQKILKEIGVME